MSALSAAARRPVAVVAESEGTLGVYAMLARDPRLPISAVALLSPIVGPGQGGGLSGPDRTSVSQDALNELNHLVGNMSPYGPGGAQELLSSVSEYGARYFDAMLRAADQAQARGDALARRGPAGRRGDASVRLAVRRYRGARLPRRTARRPGGAAHGQRVPVRPAVTGPDGRLRAAAAVITSAAAAWRMPDTGAACPYAGRLHGPVPLRAGCGARAGTGARPPPRLLGYGLMKTHPDLQWWRRP